MQRLSDSEKSGECPQTKTQGAQEKICQVEGHRGEWYKRTIFEERVMKRKERLWRYFKEIPEWYRICERCGHIEVRRTMPEDEK